MQFALFGPSTFRQCFIKNFAATTATDLVISAPPFDAAPIGMWVGTSISKTTNLPHQ